MNDFLIAILASLSIGFVMFLNTLIFKGLEGVYPNIKQLILMTMISTLVINLLTRF